MFFIEDTIAAISTPPGKGAISIIRLSGEESINIASEVFILKSGFLTTAASRYASYGKFLSGNSVIDDGIAVVYRSPHSFTGQDMVELTCHGGILATHCILEELLAHGARLAEAGEFTRRAYCSGKLDLTQAEAIALTLEANSRQALKIGASQREGILSNKINFIFTELTSLIASVYVYIDFPDELLSDVAPAELKFKIENILQEIIVLRSSYKTGKAITEGIPTAICGKPNSGKSSLLNFLLHEDRAIVTEIAGTTRDIIEETALIGEITLRISDTAGIRDTNDIIEKLGIERTVNAVNSAELIFAVFDGSRIIDDDDINLCALLREQKSIGKNIIVLINKNDLPQVLDMPELNEIIPGATFISFSTVTGKGFPELEKTINNIYIDGTLNYNTDAIITSSRQYAALYSAEQKLVGAIKSLDLGMTADIVGFDLEEALSKLGELDGRSVSEEVVDNIFHNFCVGK